MLQHPLSAAFPRMSDADFALLVDDVAEHGLRHPVVVYEGQVLDGWHRYSACLEAGVEVRTEALPPDVDPAALVLSLNLSRRHLTASQRAAAVVAVSEWKPVGKPAVGANSAPGAELAEVAGVSRRTVEAAKAAHRGGLGEAVRDGTISAKAAERSLRPAKAARPTKAAAETEAETPEDADRAEVVADLAADLEALTRIVEADDRLEAAWAEVRAAQAKYAQLEKLYAAQRVELASMTREARRWMRKAQTLEKAS